MPTKQVVHCKKEAYHVYIGRPSRWGNPFKVGKDGARGECIKLYLTWIHEPAQEWLIKEIKRELKDKVLGCWCSPRPCHGDILVKIANEVIALDPILDSLVPPSNALEHYHEEQDLYWR